MIFTLALGHKQYGIMASHLAMSVIEKGGKCGLITDDEMLSSIQDRVKFFDKIVIMPKKEYVIDGKPFWGLAKLNMYKYLPYDDALFIDADSIVGLFVNQSEMLESFKGVPFTASYYPGSWGEFDWGPQWMPNNMELPESLRGSHRLPMALSSAMMYFTKGACVEFHEKAIEAHESIRLRESGRNWRWFGSIPDELCYAIAYHNFEMPNVGDKGYLKVCSHNKHIDNIKELDTKVITFSTGNFDLSFKPKCWYENRCKYLCKENKVPYVPYKDKNKLHLKPRLKA